jgi:modification methylase
MTCDHKICFQQASALPQITDGSIDLVVTSPPYPMIEMWDESFVSSNAQIRQALHDNDGQAAFHLMHSVLDEVWKECYRVLKPGGFACINIGDATRKIGKDFKLYSNHSKIISFCEQLGFQGLPIILWRKQTNAPNKFMGSGMLPAGAYVTLEHEYICLFRKGIKQSFGEEAYRDRRNESAFFWEERNIWFSDIWDFKGAKQQLSDQNTRGRSAAFPFELPYRLINMFSLIGDRVLDPFLGTGTTTLAAIAAARNSIGAEIDSGFKETICDTIVKGSVSLNSIIADRILSHQDFIEKYSERKGDTKHVNENYGFKVVTSQERRLKLRFLTEVEFKDPLCIRSTHLDEPVLDIVQPPIIKGYSARSEETREQLSLNL